MFAARLSPPKLKFKEQEVKQETQKKEVVKFKKEIP